MRTVLVLAGVNLAVLLGLIVPVELIFGTWIRPFGVADLKRFSIPIGIQFEFDTSRLYGDGTPNVSHYTRDAWGLRGAHATLGAIEVLTVGGSTTEQRYLDDRATWQAAAETRLRELGHPLVIANAGVDGQSTVGHLFNFEFWFPMLTELHPRVVLFYVGSNDVLRHDQRNAFDAGVDANSWQVRSATFQLFRTLTSNLRARQVGVYHGRRPAITPASYTDRGLLPAQQRAEMADVLSTGFLRNIDVLRQRTVAMGATPVFMTQTALAWNAAANRPVHGLKDIVQVFGATVNYADVSALHRQLNSQLIRHCAANAITCFDLASDVSFGPDDYYDYLHNTPAGAARIGRYVADRLSQVPVRSAGPLP